MQRNFALTNLPLLLGEQDELEDDGVEDDDQDDHTSRKRKKTGARSRGGQVPKGDDFWSRVDKWFEEEIEKRDRNLTGPLWKRWSFLYFVM